MLLISCTNSFDSYTGKRNFARMASQSCEQELVVKQTNSALQYTNREIHETEKTQLKLTEQNN